jgi:thymidylate synthase (FAD)
MILIEPKVELLKEDNFYSHVANCARVCYASNNNSNISDEQFCKNILITNNHLSMFRHATIYCKYNKNDWNRYTVDTFRLAQNINVIDIGDLYVIMNGQSYLEFKKNNIAENLKIDSHIIKDLPNELKEYKRFTFKVITQISTSRELNRVSPNNIAERSTRYCNYSKDKFDNQICICKPYYYDNLEIADQLAFINRMSEYESNYLNRINRGWSPEDAREFLPLCTATEVIYTYTVKEWRHIIDLRYYGTTGKPHPNAKIIAGLIRDQLIYLGYKFRD